MSFWKHIKPVKPPPVVTAVDMRQDEKAIQMTWDDGLISRAHAQTLRQQCPCAACVDEFTGKRTLDPKSIPEHLTFSEMAPVGNYALCFTFSDGHNTGIYTWERLREVSTPISSS